MWNLVIMVNTGGAKLFCPHASLMIEVNISKYFEFAQILQLCNVSILSTVKFDPATDEKVVLLTACSPHATPCLLI